MDSKHNGESIPAREYPGSPQVAVGAIVVEAGRVLLVKRSQPPGKGVWAIPGGRVELGETLKEAAEREVREETGLRVRAREPVYTFEVIKRDGAGRVRFHYVIVDLKAEYLSGGLNPGDDVSEARWVVPEELNGLLVSQSTRDVLGKVIHFACQRPSSIGTDSSHK